MAGSEVRERALTRRQFWSIAVAQIVIAVCLVARIIIAIVQGHP